MEGADHVTFRVADTGIGIAPEDHERIFEKFHQVGDTLTDKPKGTGLGLSIVQQIVLQHGGEICAVNAPGQGAEFVVSLPVRRA